MWAIYVADLCIEVLSNLCSALGILPTVRHADYIGSWLEALREDGRAIFGAASAASKAADWLLACHREAQGVRIAESLVA